MTAIPFRAHPISDGWLIRTDSFSALVRVLVCSDQAIEGALEDGERDPLGLRLDFVGEEVTPEILDPIAHFLAGQFEISQHRVTVLAKQIEDHEFVFELHHVDRVADRPIVDFSKVVHRFVSFDDRVIARARAAASRSIGADIVNRFAPRRKVAFVHGGVAA